MTGALHVRLLATSDMHGHLSAWDYHTGREAPYGLSRVATAVARLRGEAGLTLLLDNGDTLQGSALADHAADAGGQGHPVILAMNHMRYDAATLGNHEFNYGLPFLRQVLAGAAFPVVAANITVPEGAIAPRHVVLDRVVRGPDGRDHALRIGVIGFLPPQVTVWDRAHLDGRLEVEGIVAAARAQIPALRAMCDLVVVLAHTGFGDGSPAPEAENAALALAEVERIDAIVTGHTHVVFPAAPHERLGGCPAVAVGARGSHLGVVDLWLDPATKAVQRAEARAIDMSAEMPDPELERVVAPAHEAVLDLVARPVGVSEVPLNTFFALIAPSPAVALIADAAAAHVRALLPDEDVVLATGLPFKAGGRGGCGFYTDVPAGPLSNRHIADIYSYPNTLDVLRMTGAEVATWLERATSIFRQITPGVQDQDLLDPDFAAYHFDIIHGVDFAIDLARPPMFDAAGRQIGAGRIADLRLKGRPLSPDQCVIVATSNYRANGTGGFAPRAPFLRDVGRVQDVIRAHAAQAPVTALRPFWRFLPMPGTSVRFETAPAALHHLAEVPHLALTPLGVGTDGFLRLRLDL
ncbi:5'-nucleotidase C-terminal domain-containing protein [Falsirhodobacter algicola]|uniref:2',3'-cyclic-nucleotide 2'-phosphodiesterase n=1 Tax=Falsirhodobacter algicola TaxID=2692330 RepID=A0A8J8MQZ5_9RHOB|nr:5'-nucleotidase C-terminal domain-containing protein [Falsirhodobacter algicola]QUS34834.1 2',3'-cyclic-nucleotide 2'-phosphodiesterase [Falsirhodobacter algicola]